MNPIRISGVRRFDKVHAQAEFQESNFDVWDEV
jgi:hypothetical protein